MLILLLISFFVTSCLPTWNCWYLFLAKCVRTAVKPWLWTGKNKSTNCAIFGIKTAAKSCKLKQCAGRVRNRTDKAYLNFLPKLYFCLNFHLNWTFRLPPKRQLRGCSHDTRMIFIPEWVSFQNEVRTVFTWQNRPAQPSWKRPFYPPSWKRYACATRPRLRSLRFHHGTEFVFSLHDTRMKCHTRTRISFGLKTVMNSFRNDLCGT